MVLNIVHVEFLSSVRKFFMQANHGDCEIVAWSVIFSLLVNAIGLSNFLMYHTITDFSTFVPWLIQQLFSAHNI